MKFLLIFAISLYTGLCAHSHELLITGSELGPPKYYNDLNGKPKGFVVDITQWVLNNMEQPHNIRLLPWKRAYWHAVNGKSGIIGLSMSSERLKIFDYSNPLYFGEIMVIVKKGNEFPYSSISDLRGKRVGAGRGVSYGDAFNKAARDETFNVIEYNKPIHSIKMLLAGRIDALLMGPGKHGISQSIETDSQLNMGQFTILPIPFKRDAKYLGFHKSMKMKPFLKKFNASLKKAWDTGVVDNFVKSYY